MALEIAPAVGRSLFLCAPSSVRIAHLSKGRQRRNSVVTIRLARHGGKKNPFYHITVAEKRAKRDGRFIERVGFYNPISRGEGERLRLNLERVDHWLAMGAQPTARVAQLIRQWRKRTPVAGEAKASNEDAATDEAPAVDSA